MVDSYPHLRLTREVPVNQRRPRQPPRVKEPDDPAGHGRALLQSLRVGTERAALDIGGFDSRRLFKFEIQPGLDPKDLHKISADVELVSQETKTVALAFATEEALAEFEARLSTLAEGGKPTYRNILYALKGFDRWSEEDRQGWALRREGWPVDASFLVDVELWPLSRQAERDHLCQSFEAWARGNQIEKRDTVKQVGLLLYRLRVTRDQAALLLRHRDVRMIDLPPRYGLEVSLLYTNLQDLPPVPAPPDDSPSITILDSGVVTGHPLLGPAIGDAQSFLPGVEPRDEHGHGTQVAGIALYGDVEAAARSGRFVPALRLFSGRILDDNNTNETGFVENHVESAVRYFYREYGCRIFNLSFGDRRKPYRGGRVRGLAVTLDTLTRELGVLFVVPTGNFYATEEVPGDWREDYPNYLLSSESSLLDPAPGLNVITVGSLARWDRSFNSQRYQDDPSEPPIARTNQPSPFTRSGPSVNGAIKPELVAYGGNWAVNTRTTPHWLIDHKQGLGEISVCRDFAAGRLLAEDCGTSFAAPYVAHLAARILGEHPDASNNLLRALLIAHARIPDACSELLNNRDNVRRLCGYGQVQEQALYRSNEQEVTLVVEDTIPDKSHHFYEIPVPDDFYSGRQRMREITVALAHSPAVRTTRVNYKTCRIDFKLVSADSLEHVVRMFNAATAEDEYERIPEIANASINGQDRGKGTVQAATWTLRRVAAQRRQQHLFVVVTRNDQGWATDVTAIEEAYALAVFFRDREGVDVQLYTQIQNRLRARVQQRVRA